MKTIDGIGLTDVQAVYNGPEGVLWELVMGEQIHIGGFASSLDLAEKAEIADSGTGVDLCCCNGAGMRFLLRFANVATMTGVDATQTVVDQGIERCEAEGVTDRTNFVLADACETTLPDGQADFVWGEDAWCYVSDKPALVAEAARIVKPGGTIAFTDWVEGPAGLSDEEAARFLAFMKFPNIQDIEGYRTLLTDNGCEVKLAEDTGRFASHVELYLNMLNMQLTYDALKIIGFNTELLGAMGAEMQFMKTLADEGKIAQGIFIANKS
jgi:SAM-dependent methyltransferase